MLFASSYLTQLLSLFPSPPAAPRPQALPEWKAYHAELGDSELVWDPWVKGTHDGKFPNVSRGKRFRSAIRNSPIGPNSTIVIKTDRATRYGNALLLIESEMNMPDAPYGSHFCVLEKWVVRTVPNKSNRVPVVEFKVRAPAGCGGGGVWYWWRWRCPGRVPTTVPVLVAMLIATRI